MPKLNIDFYSNWFSLQWFSPYTLKEFYWDNSLFLYLLPAIPALFLIRWGVYYKFRQKFDIALLSSDLKDKTFVGTLRFIPYLFMGLFACMVVIALARPQKINHQIEQWSEGIDIMLMIDVSESMQLEDFKPNRLEAAKAVAIDFIKGRMHDKIGIVVFSGEAYSLSPLTTDYQLLISFIKGIKSDIIPYKGTAIGNAIGTSINRLRESENKSKVAILISDGDNTAGNLDPIMAAKLAHAYNIKLYTIGIGKDGKVPFENTVVESSLNEITLRKISQIGEGKFYRAANVSSLKEIFFLINKYEKAEIKETKYRDTEDYYQIYLIWGMVFCLIWIFTKITFMSNALED